MKKETEIIEEDAKKGIIIIVAAIAVVIGLIVLTAHLSSNAFSEEKPTDDNKVETKKDENISENKGTTNSNVISTSTKTYVVRYLDIDGGQLGKTQRLNSLEDRINEKAPKIDGMRFVEWMHKYDQNEDIHYYIASYRENVEVVTEDVKVIYKNTPSVTSTVVPVESETENPTYEVIIEGEIPEVDEIEEDVTISEEYEHILALRFYAPEDVTEEDIENMSINVYATNEDETLDEDQYSYNGEDKTKTGRDLLDSTDEEYANGIFYFNYYQETDTKTNATIEVYWGNDHDANETTPPKDEYVEVYNVIVDNKKEDEEEQELE